MLNNKLSLTVASNKNYIIKGLNIINIKRILESFPRSLNKECEDIETMLAMSEEMIAKEELQDGEQCQKEETETNKPAN